MLNPHHKGPGFERDVRELLSLKGYHVIADVLVQGTQIDLIAEKSDPLENSRFIVECTERDTPVGVDLLKEKAAVLLALNDPKYIYRILMVSKRGFTKQARAFAESQPNIVLMTLQDLENTLIDFSSYINWYLSNYREGKGIFKDADLFSSYIELSARTDDGKKRGFLTAMIDDWLSEHDDNNLLFLLGEYGSGKTSFCRQLVYLLLERKLKGVETLIPILINLKEYRKAFNIQQVITDTLINSYGIPIHSFLAFERICSLGKLLLVLDGFDEMAATSDKRTLVDCFTQIYILAHLNARILMTCRSNFFRSQSDVIELVRRFNINVPVIEAGKKITAEIRFDQHGRILHVEKFNDDQVRQFIRKRLPENADWAIQTLQQIHDLSDLSTRPVLLDMIVKTLPILSQDEKKINSASLYEHYTNRWTFRDEWRVIIPKEIREDFCISLAWWMHRSHLEEVEYQTLEAVMIGSLKQWAKSEQELEQFKNDIQTCSFLVRSSGSNAFRFAHKSFMEFFVAKKLVGDLVTGNDSLGVDRWLHHDKHIVLSEDIPPIAGEILLHYTFNSILEPIMPRIAGLGGYTDIKWKDWKALSYFDSRVKSQLEHAIGKVLTARDLSRTGKAVGITEEIATFASEHLVNIGVSIEEFVPTLKGQSCDVFCDILRLGRSPHLASQSREFMKNYVVHGEKEDLKIAFAVALTSLADAITAEFVETAQSNMMPDGWSYFIFELASKKRYEPIMRILYDKKELGTIDKLICYFGFQDELPESESDFISEKLIVQLVSSPKIRDQALGVGLLILLDIPEDKLTNIIRAFYSKCNDSSVKKELISAFGHMKEKSSWQLAQFLAGVEKDPILRKLLVTAEKQIRDNMSREGSQKNWKKMNRASLFKENLWKSLRL